MPYLFGGTLDQILSAWNVELLKLTFLIVREQVRRDFIANSPHLSSNGALAVICRNDNVTIE
jgi:hypothetical protein